MESIKANAVEPFNPVEGVRNANLLEGERMNLLEFHIEPGMTVPDHEHPHEQMGYIISGEATFVVNGESTVLGPGDGYRIPGGETHRLENRGEDPVLGVDVFSPPRDIAPFADE